jgi:hypothetical protein
MPQMIVVALLVVLASFLGGGIAHAVPISFLQLDSGAYLQDTATYDIKETVTTTGSQLTRTAGEAYSYFGPQGVTGSYTASGDVSYGVLKATINGDATGLGVQPFFNLFSQAYYADTLTFTTANGLGGFAYLTFTLDGFGVGPLGNQTVVGGVHATAFGGFQSGLFGSAETTHFLETTDTFAAATFTSDPIPFSSGASVTVDANLSAEVALYCVDAFPVGFGCGHWGGGAISNFGNTGVLSGITLVDNAGNSIATFTVTAASGTQLGPNGVLVTPEPATFYLLGTGLFGVRKWRRHLTERKR